MRCRLFVTCIAAVLLAAGCMPQQSGQSSMTQSSAAMSITPATKSYINAAMISDQFEIESSQLALERSRSPAVRSFAEQMIRDHRMSSEKMKTALRADGLPVQAAALDDRHRRMLVDLRGQDGAAFDRAYMQAQVQAHQEALNIHRNYATQGDMPALRAFASEAATVVQQHATHAQQTEMRTRTGS